MLQQLNEASTVVLPLPVSRTIRERGVNPQVDLPKVALKQSASIATVSPIKARPPPSSSPSFFQRKKPSGAFKLTMPILYHVRSFRPVSAKCLRKAVGAGSTEPSVCEEERLNEAGGERGDMLLFLLRLGADVNGLFGGESLLHVIARRGLVSRVRLLSLFGADLEKKRKWGETPLMVSLEAGRLEVVRALAEMGADVNCAAERRWRGGLNASALSIASQKGYADLVQVILDRKKEKGERGGSGADGEGKASSDEERESFLEACRKGHTEVVRLFVDWKKEFLNAATATRATGLWLASSQGHTEVVHLLLTRGATVDTPDRSLWTPLMAASQNGWVSVVETLLYWSANVNAVDYLGATPLMVASTKNCQEVVRVLLQAGADVNATAKDGLTAFTAASRIGHAETVQILCDWGCKGEDRLSRETISLSLSLAVFTHRTEEFV
uniref:Uncharacterized protein n=1 Tax=Chromera velia CCMP2878 TaxID=1169474 RepID=A0A0G4GFH9_9ALVE|eukprot:Cvel_21585.t1-p1 / transcript=Cvel_21585.t1 / gene=Cvel_21585 / organism=Chromera_velia_CCMP2878 / gene_product=Ankyrin repeat and KH domain-containing protein, putative / transcript_product=Ankyrin repeat and KH domain-containing protein, putative / location=Cvel_scaffold2038:1226-2545(-) / protein_length=440 / sequence_SO=supercontig / SO=protein_coding / is_pseudo=false